MGLEVLSNSDSEIPEVWKCLDACVRAGRGSGQIHPCPRHIFSGNHNSPSNGNSPPNPADRNSLHFTWDTCGLLIRPHMQDFCSLSEEEEIDECISKISVWGK